MKTRFGEVHQLFAPSPNGWYWRSAADHGWIVIWQELPHCGRSLLLSAMPAHGPEADFGKADDLDL
jgi:hypothetical protein